VAPRCGLQARRTTARHSPPGPSALLSRPGLRAMAPSRRTTVRASAIFGKLFRSDPAEKTRKIYQNRVDAINTLEAQMKALSDEQLRAKTAVFKARVAKGESLESILPEAFAVRTAWGRMAATCGTHACRRPGGTRTPPTAAVRVHTPTKYLRCLPARQPTTHQHCCCCCCCCCRCCCCCLLPAACCLLLLLLLQKVVREGSARVLGLRPFDTQLIGGVILHEGQIAEMRTGEGKTLVAVRAVHLGLSRAVHALCCAQQGFIIRHTIPIRYDPYDIRHAPYNIRSSQGDFPYV
jgi:hypothetical protein